MAPACLLGECSTSGRQLLTAPRAGLLRRAAAGRPGCCRPGHRQLAGSFRAPTTCSVATHELSTYKFPSRKPEVHQWLESCIQDAVKHLDQAPFLQMVYPDRPFKQLERHSVVQAVVSVPQLWRPIAEHLSHAKPEVVVLVHNLPVAAAKANECVLAGKRQAQNVMTGIAAHHSLTPAGCDQLVQTGMATNVFSGRVGDCCDGEEPHAHHEQHDHAQHGAVVSQVVPFSHSHSHSQRHHHEHGFSGEEQAIDFWGVVVQSKLRSSAEGCYVLKTVRSVDPVGCQCTHYSLTRVCRGEPIAAQLSSAWL